ncbi:MYND Zn-finger protein [Ceratobasidium sp. AG-Ba]|nr:MYND Zn-finger protein [Ceratobasidium sp. AG-Ba]
MHTSSSQAETPELPSLPDICNACGNLAVFLCPRCQYVWYCSIQCQERDLIAHEQLCPLLAGVASDGPPQPDEPIPFPADNPSSSAPESSPVAVENIRVFVLPVDQIAHHDTRIELRATLGLSGGMKWTPQLGHLLPEDPPPTSAIIIKGTGGQVLRFPLHLFFQTQPNDIPQADINWCVRALTQGTSRSWQGNIVVLKFNGARRRGYKDIEHSDLPTIRHFLKGYWQTWHT